jgi:alpha-tubulin suppressor-like RCC1 family protein
MRQLCCIQSRLIRGIALVFAPALVLAALGCRQESTSPSIPEPGEALAVAATPALAFRQMSAGGGHACSVTPDNLAYCWGANNAGQLGNGTNTGPETCGRFEFPCSTRPVAVAGGLRFRMVSAGDGHTCGVTTSSEAYCWGATGPLGEGSDFSGSIPTPVAVAGGLQFSHVAAGSGHTCGVTTDNLAYCWGGNGSAQLGDGTTTNHLTPSAVTGGLRFSRLDAGGGHNCARTLSDNVYCWGLNISGQLGNGTRGPENCKLRNPSCSTIPRRVLGIRFRLRQVSAGGTHTCGLKGKLAYCWGRNAEGQLGDGTNSGHLEPVAVSDARQFRDVSAGRSHTCAVNPLNVTFCWGDNSIGQLGDNTTNPRVVPVRVVGGLRFSQVSAGSTFTCGVSTENLAYCWGNNGSGMLGDGTHVTHRRRPTPVVGPS